MINRRLSLRNEVHERAPINRFASIERVNAVCVCLQLIISIIAKLCTKWVSRNDLSGSYALAFSYKLSRLKLTRSVSVQGLSYCPRPLGSHLNQLIPLSWASTSARLYAARRSSPEAVDDSYPVSTNDLPNFGGVHDGKCQQLNYFGFPGASAFLLPRSHVVGLSAVDDTLHRLSGQDL